MHTEAMIMTEQETTKQSSIPAERMVVAQLQNIRKDYGAVPALRSLNLSIHAGELVALLGPNGAGKTTVVKLLLGLARPSAGFVKVFGGDPTCHEIRTRTGAMLQVARVPETLRVREHIDLFCSYYLRPMPVADALALAGLQEIKDRKFGDLSGGQRQRVLFALALCGNPDLLFLDEPTVGLDVEARRTFWAEIRKLVHRGKSVLLTTHYLEEAEALADRVVVINKGAIVAHGTPAEIRAQTAGKRIRCSTRTGLDEVREIPGVVSVTLDKNILEIRATEAEAIVRDLLSRDRALSGLEVTSAGLEDAFLALTQEHNRMALS
jgi:ABC-2 type transport system ATP-binding protein